MKARLRHVPLALIAGVMVVCLVYGLSGPAAPGEGAVRVDRPPRISPDYAGAVIPPNIAPLNFRIHEPGRRYWVAIGGQEGRPIEVGSRDGGVVIPAGPWRRLLEAHRGGKVRFSVFVLGEQGVWSEFGHFDVSVASDPIDPYVVYRSMNPIYRMVTRLDLRQRDLTGYDEEVVLSSKGWGGCMNCHTFLKNSPDDMLFHLRSGRTTYGRDEDVRGNGMVLVRDGEIRKVDARTQYSIGAAAHSSWHPSGRVIAFSMNKVRQFFHTARIEVRDTLDFESDLAVYLTDTDEVTSTRAIASPDRLETWPTWSPDGRHLYFCSAPMLWEKTEQDIAMARYGELKYGLMRLPYDIETGAWGKLETVLSAEETGMSINQPRFSPEGRFLVLTACDYGYWPALRPNSDLYMLDTETGEFGRMACSSVWTDSWHSWSSNGRWLAFSSKRPDGQFMKIHFTYVDADGNDHRPFIMPQRDPAYYDSFVRVNQLPELITKPIPVSQRRLVTAIETQSWEKGSLPVTSATATFDPGVAQEGGESGLPIWTVQ